MKPLLFVDIDGVLNCPGSPDGACAELRVPLKRMPAPDDRTRRMLAKLFPGRDPDEPEATHTTVWLPVGSQERVRRLAEMFEPVWCTAWRDGAHHAFWEILELAQTPEWPSVSWEGMKLPAILAMAGDRPWAFIDDDIAYELDHLDAPLPAAPEHLLVQPDSFVGMTDEHVIELLAFAARVS